MTGSPAVASSSGADERTSTDLDVVGVVGADPDGVASVGDAVVAGLRPRGDSPPISMARPDSRVVKGRLAKPVMPEALLRKVRQS